MFSNKCKIVTQSQFRFKAKISLPIYIQIIIRGPIGGFIFFILGAQGGGVGEAKIKKSFEKSQSPFTN